MIDRMKVAENAGMIVNGYAFTREGEIVRVLNLNNPDMATVFDSNGEVLETSMNDIEIRIAKEYLHNNAEFLED